MCTKDQFQQVGLAHSSQRGLLLGLKERNRGLIPGVKIPEPVERMGRVRGIQHQQFSHVAQIQQCAIDRIVVNLLAGKLHEGCI